MKRLRLILALISALSTMEALGGYSPNLEYAVYNPVNSLGAVAVVRGEGKFEFRICAGNFTADNSNPKAAAEFSERNCHDVNGFQSGESLKTDVTIRSISGGAMKVVNFAQVWMVPDNANESAEISSSLSTWRVNNPINPVSFDDRIVYTAATIRHDHGATPQILTVRITYQLAGVTRKIVK